MVEVAPESELTRKLHSTTDAAVWAKEFVRIWYSRRGEQMPSQDEFESFMISWFANAIEVGREAGRSAQELDDELYHTILDQTWNLSGVQPTDARRLARELAREIHAAGYVKER